MWELISRAVYEKRGFFNRHGWMDGLMDEQIDAWTILSLKII